MSGSRPSRHLLTVLHAAERTGPPLLALQFLRWLAAERPAWQLSTTFLDQGGPLVPDFESLGAVVVPDARIPGTDDHPWLAGKLRARRVQNSLRALGPIDLAHVHCAGSMRVRPFLPPTRILCHLHELSTGLDLHLDPLARQHLTSADRYVAVSDGVRQEFLSRFTVDPALVERQWGFVDERLLARPADRAAVELDHGAFVVLSSGVRHWRKAPELFARVAHRARALRPDVPWSFVWIGGEDTGGLQSLVDRTEPEGLIRFVTHQDDPLRWVAASDVFLLTAREDAFPLVCVEAAGLGRPIVTFENGGAAELVRAADCGAVVPFPDVNAMATALIELADDPFRQRRWQESGRDFALEHLTLGTAAPKLLSTIEGTLQ
jgi:glycosyltransferase involved in cell wall biosynthesis